MRQKWPILTNRSICRNLQNSRVCSHHWKYQRADFRQVRKLRRRLAGRTACIVRTSVSARYRLRIARSVTIAAVGACAFVRALLVVLVAFAITFEASRTLALAHPLYSQSLRTDGRIFF